MKSTAFIFLVKTVVQHHYIRMTPTIFAQGTLFHLGQDVPNTFRMRDEIRKKKSKGGSIFLRESNDGSAATLKFMMGSKALQALTQREQ